MQLELSHVNDAGSANMVDVSEKAISARTAQAHCYVHVSPATMQLIIENQMKKGDVLAVARIAGIQAAKKCADLIPLCHPLMLSKVQLDFELEHTSNRISVLCTCKLSGQTGVEMEALTGASIAACTIFDMCKAVDKRIHIEDLRVIAKSGGKSGDWGEL